VSAAQDFAIQADRIETDSMDDHVSVLPRGLQVPRKNGLHIHTGASRVAGVGAARQGERLLDGFELAS